MTPTQNFENYPEFANAGQKSKPNDAKYAAGFIPSDVLPAEWLNWFLNGATKGITALNTGVKSVEQEINAVLASRSVPPDINAAGQLLSVLNKIKEEAINEAWPVGITYVQYPQQKSPQELFPKTTWKEISYDGAFFRASGGNAADFIEKSGVLSKQSGQNLKHSHSASSGSMSKNSSGIFTPGQGICVSVPNNNQRPGQPTGACRGSPVGVYNSGNKPGDGRWIGYIDNAGINVQHTHSISVNDDGGNESRPDNYTIRIWKRTA